MVQDSLFKKVTLEVRNICYSLNYPFSFNRYLGYITVYGRLTGQGSFIIPSTVIDSICSVSNVEFVSVSIDSTGRLCALFLIKEVTDGNID